MSPHPDHDLLQAYLDGELSADGAAALEVRLTVEPGLSDELIRLGREEAIMREWAGATAVAEQATREEAIAPSAAPRRSQRRRFVAMAVVAACVAGVCFALLNLPRGPGPISGQVLATIEEVQGEVRVVTPEGRSELAENGQSLFAGQEVETGQDDSSTVVRVPDGRLTLSCETRIRVGRGDDPADSSPLFFVSEGIVNAVAARKALVLRSAFAELRGKDGKFSFVSLPDSTRIEADDGHGRLTRKSDGRSVEMKRGQFAVVKRGVEPLLPEAMASRMTSPRRALAVGGGPIRGLFFDPEEKWLLTCSAEAIKRFDLGSGKLAATVWGPKKRAVRGFAAAPDGRAFALATEERHVRLIDAATGDDIWIHRGAKRVAAIAVAPDGRTIAVSRSAKDGNEVKLYDTTLGVERTLHTGHTGPVTVLAFSPRGHFLATAGPDRSIRVWGARDLEPVHTITKLPQEPRSLAFSPDERLLAAGDRGGIIRLFDPETGSERSPLTGHLRDVLSLAFAPDGLTLASGSGDGTARIWNIARGVELASFKGHPGAVGCVAYSQDGRTLATGGPDKKVLLWDLMAKP